MSADDEDCDFMNVPAETPLSPEEAIVRRHRREKRELQGKILAMKKNVSNKKKKKELTDEIAKLEAELESRHKLELDTFRPGMLGSGAPVIYPETVTEEEPQLPQPDLDNSQNQNSVGHGSAPGTPKMSKARRRREKKEAEEKEKQMRIAAESSVLLENSQMKAEDDCFVEMMKSLNLAIVDIDPDGNCLYNAVSDQLKQFGENLPSDDLRSRTAAYLRQHKDEYIPFMDEAHSSDEGFEIYCSDLEHKPVWGGQLEVRMLSQILQRPIKILQAQGSPVVFGDNFSTEQLTLTYHRHKYQLGEHYNSTKVS